MTRSSLSARAYRLLSPGLARLARSSGRVSAKWREGVEGRRGLADRLRSAGPDLRGCLWVHAASVGEYEQARPVLRALRAAGHGPLAVTHFSSSGLDYARRHPEADLHEYLPLDAPEPMAELVAAWRPRLLAFAKYDCWPNQVFAADAAGVPIVLFAGALPAGSFRLKAPVRPLVRDVFDRFSRIGVGSESDRRRFVTTLGVRAPVEVTGDTRAEQVLNRFRKGRQGDLATSLRRWGGRRLVLGSTWPPDERRWLPALADLLRHRGDLRIVLTPHEPTPEHLADLETALDAGGIRHRRLAAWSGPEDPSRCLIVDRVGVLAEIYAAGTVAYVGGGFTTGVHSTLEPAAADLPVIFGPRIGNAEEALEMVRRGGGRVVRTTEETRETAARWLDDEAARMRAGEIARAVVDAQVGATARTVAMIETVLQEAAQER